MKILIIAMMWGCISAVSLPIGAIIGLLTNPRRKVISALMAFGGGALLFALTIELFAHALHKSKEHHDIWIILATMVGAILGGLTFEFLNQILNNKGAFLRKASLLKKHVLKIKRGRAKKMIHALSNVKILQLLPAEEVVQLIPHVKTVRFSAGKTIFSQGDPASELYFIVEGSVQVLRGSGPEAKLIAELGEGDTFGEIALISDQPRTATVRAKTDTEVCTIHKLEFEQLIKQSPAVRDASSKMVKERLYDIQIKDGSVGGEAIVWEERAQSNLDRLSIQCTERDLDLEIKEHTDGSAALAIWMGIALDAIPESRHRHACRYCGGIGYGDEPGFYRRCISCQSAGSHVQCSNDEEGGLQFRENYVDVDVPVPADKYGGLSGSLDISSSSRRRTAILYLRYRRTCRRGHAYHDCRNHASGGLRAGRRHYCRALHPPRFSDCSRGKAFRPLLTPRIKN